MKTNSKEDTCVENSLKNDDSVKQFSPTSNNESDNSARLNKRWEMKNTKNTKSESENVKKTDSLQKMSLEYDSVHEQLDQENFIAPGQLYSTISGNMFHAGKILIALVGLPATSKTLLAVSMTRYSRWLGVRTKSYHVSEYRRNYMKTNNNNSSINTNSLPNSLGIEMKMVNLVINDMLNFFQENNGQIAIYDSLNITKLERLSLQKKFNSINVKVLFIESIITDSNLVNENIELALKSNEYLSWRKEDAIEYYNKKLQMNELKYEKIDNNENISFLKYINFGERLIINNKDDFGYLINKIVSFLLNLRNNNTGHVFLARCGTSDFDRYIDDELLNDEGIRYSQDLTDLILNRLENVHNMKNSQDKLIIWTGPRKRTKDTANKFKDMGYSVQEKSQLKQLHPGVIADMNNKQIKADYLNEFNEFQNDPYHYRFPRAESYHDLAVRMEPLLLELEHTKKDVLIIAHETTLRVLYGYLLACSASCVPNLEFPRNILTEITFGPFRNTVEKIRIQED